MQEMKYFNEGNDCDICKNQLMTGGDRTVEDCRRRQNGLSCRFEERDIRTCPVCEHEVDREDMYFTKDCHGIPFRLDWCVTDAIRESCQKDMTGNITQRQTNRLRTTIESRNGQQSPVCVG